MKINRAFYIALIVLLISGCTHNQKFDSAIWNQKGVDWWMTDVRENMVDDLVKSDRIIGMTREQIEGMLGLPKTVSQNELIYLIREKYGTDIDPDYISNLKIVLDGNGLATHCKVEK